jgi:hypothetical protein
MKQFAAVACNSCHTYHLVATAEGSKITTIKNDLHMCHYCEKTTCTNHGGWLTPEVDGSLTEKIWACDNCMLGEDTGDPLLMDDATIEKLVSAPIMRRARRWQIGIN